MQVALNDTPEGNSGLISRFLSTPICNIQAFLPIPEKSNIIGARCAPFYVFLQLILNPEFSNFR